jgi:hypothetical protein
MKGQSTETHPSTQAQHDQTLEILGHELANVLNGMLGLTGLLRDSRLSPEQEGWIGAIENSGQQIRRLVDFFCNQHGFSQDSLPARPRLTDGIGLLEHVLMSHTPAARSRNNHLYLIVDPELPRSWSFDPCLFRQLLDNLIGNAVRFTSQGDCIIELTALGRGRSTAALGLTVTDSGIGICVGSGDRIYQAFRKNFHASAVGSGGKGLGLHICRNIVGAMGGTIDWSRPDGGGTCFNVVLPGAIEHVETKPRALTSGLLGQLFCRLSLVSHLRRAVSAHLTRLGVEWCDTDKLPEKLPEDRLIVGIEYRPAPSGETGALLQLVPMAGSGTKRPTRSLEVPVLESNLGIALLEIALESFRPGAIPDEKRDSVHEPC